MTSSKKVASWASKSAHALYLKRSLKNKVVITIATIAVMVALYFLGWILYTLVAKGFASFQLKTFVENTPPPGSSGGLLNAIVGSFMMVGIASIAGLIVGVFVVIYFSEFGKNNALTHVTRFINDVLLSAPSVILGLFIYQLYVIKVGHFSGWAGAIVLSIITIPIIIRTTDNVFALVPRELKEAGYALGAPQWKIILRIILPITKTGIITGTILAIARISGETAPLLFTALNNQFWNADMNKPMANLPVVIFQYAMSPYKDWQDLAWSGALILTLFVFCLNISVRILFRQKIVLH